MSYLIDSVVKTLIKFGDLPDWFKYEIKKSEEWNFKIISDYKDSLVSKAFINHINDIFSPVSLQRYMIDIFSLKNKDWKLEENRILFSLPNIVAKNWEYRDEIEWNLSDSFMKIIYWRIIFAYKKSFTYVKILINKLKWIKMLSSRKDEFWLLIASLFVIFIITYVTQYLEIFSYILYIILALLWLYFLFFLIIWISIIILIIYMNIWTIFKYTYWFVVLFSFFIFFSLVQDNPNSPIFSNLSIFCLFNFVFISTIFIYKKIMHKYLFIFFWFTNKKQITANNKLTKTWINSDYIRFIYLNSPDVDKNEYIWKKPFISWKIEKLWI